MIITIINEGNLRYEKVKDGNVNDAMREVLDEIDLMEDDNILIREY